MATVLKRFYGKCPRALPSREALERFRCGTPDVAEWYYKHPLLQCVGCECACGTTHQRGFIIQRQLPLPKA